MEYSVCKDNHKLITVNPIFIDWDTPFINLFFDREKAHSKLFADNGREWQYSDTDEDSSRTTLLNVYLDENDHISSLSIYKYQLTSFGHGKSSSNELKVTTSDIKENLAVLSEVVSDTSVEELEKLLSDIKDSKFGRERNLKVGKAKVTLQDKDGIVRTIKKKTLLKAIQISHVYLEIFKSSKVFDLCTKDFPEEIHSVVQEILSFNNINNYYKLDSLKEEMELRNLTEEADHYYPILRQAVIDGDLAKVKELARFAKVYPYPCPGGSALYCAVKDNKNEIAQVLLENGAYVLEIEGDGSHYPLEIAYNNGNRELAKLLIKYHGGKVKTYNVNKHNTDNLLKSLAKNADYEILRLVSPEAFSSDSRSWLEPDMFPSINDETIHILSTIDGLRINWSMSIIRTKYEDKDFELCKRMLVQGTTEEVVRFFINENNYELFQASLHSHPELKNYRSYDSIYERGGMWYEALSHNILNLHQYRDNYFEKMLNSEEVDRYLEIMARQGYPFYGLEGYMLRPEKVMDPKSYIRLINTYIDKIPSNKGNRRLLFLEDIIRVFGDEKLAKKYYSKYPLPSATEWRAFVRNTVVCKYIQDDMSKNYYAGAELVRSFLGHDIDRKDNIVYELFNQLVYESNLWKQNAPVYDEDQLDGKEKRILYILRAVIECISLKKLDEIIDKKHGAQGISNAYQFAVSYGKNIRNQLFFNILKE